MVINYVHIVEQTHKEKVEMYMKFTKKELIAMLIECNKYIGNPKLRAEEFKQAIEESKKCLDCNGEGIVEGSASDHLISKGDGKSYVHYLMCGGSGKVKCYGDEK